MKFICTLTVFLLSTFSMAPICSSETFSVIQVTKNNFPDGWPQINGNEQIVWRGGDYADPGYGIYLFNGVKIKKLADTQYSVRFQINDDGLVVWEDQGEVILYDGLNTTVLSSNNTGNNPCVSGNGYITWAESVYDGGFYYNAQEIFRYNGIEALRITDNTYHDGYPRINALGHIVWEGTVTSSFKSEIFLYDGVQVKQLTHNEYRDADPQINANGDVVWWGDDGSDNEIFLYDAATQTITQITDNAYNDGYPQINDSGEVVWAGTTYPGYFADIFLYDGTDIIQITDTLFHEARPQLNNQGHVVWQGRTESEVDYEIFFYDGTSTFQITDNTVTDEAPQINDNDFVVWQGYEGLDLDYEIFLAIPIGNPSIENILTFFEQGIEKRTIKVKVPKWLRDTGNKKRIKRFKRQRTDAMKALIETAQRLINGGFDSAACSVLETAFGRCDGQKEPGDWFKGSGYTPVLADMLHALLLECGCEIYE